MLEKIRLCTDSNTDGQKNVDGFLDDHETEGSEEPAMAGDERPEQRPLRHRILAGKIHRILSVSIRFLPMDGWRSNESADRRGRTGSGLGRKRVSRDGPLRSDLGRPQSVVRRSFVDLADDRVDRLGDAIVVGTRRDSHVRSLGVFGSG